MAYRRTLRREVGCTGIGLHSGKPVRLSLRPAPAEHGIRFLRSDVGVEIPATLEYLASQDHATTLSRDGVSIGTVEHLLSALLGLGMDDVLVEVDGPEIPVLDGSAAPFVILRHQALSVRVSPRTYCEGIAPARTFGFLRDVETLRRSGLALGGSLENAVVIGETGVLNNKLRFEDEFVRHKVLDAIGDLALLGAPLIGHFEAQKAGHALHAAVAQKLLATTGAWALVPSAGIPALDAPAPASA